MVKSHPSQVSGFRDRSVVFCRPNDPRLGRLNWPETGGFEQTEIGPVLLVIGSETTGATCRKLAERFGVTADEIMAFRDGEVDESGAHL